MNVHKITILPEATYAQEMEQVVEPYLNKVIESGEFTTSHNEKLYYEFFPHKEAKATIVISYGFIEFVLKYHEMIYYFHKQGFAVAILEHRGHGKSLREVDHKDLVHVERFSRYVEDFHEFVTHFVKPRANNKPLYLYAHSMGGCIGALYLEEHPKIFQKAVLSTPMLGVYSKPIPVFVAELLSDINIWLGRGNQPVFVHPDYDPDLPFDLSPGDSKERFLHYLALQKEDESYQTVKASYRWVKESIAAGRIALRHKRIERVRIPVLLFQAGIDKFVTPKEQVKFAAGISNGRLIVIPDTRHEIYRARNEILERYLEEILDFFISPQSAAPA